MSTIDLNTPDDQKTRVELTLDRMAKAWLGQTNGREFAQAMLDFFRSIKNHNTFRAYTFSILEFFDWYHSTKTYIPTPAQVRRADAVEYVEWLSNREHGLEGWRIKTDPYRSMDRVIFEFVKKTPGTNIESIRSELSGHLEFTTVVETAGQSVRMLKVDAEQADGLAHHLSCLVERKSLVRSPTHAEIRAGKVNTLGADPSRFGIDYAVDPSIYKYTIPSVVTEPGIARASTISSRLMALSSFWSYLSHSGENVGQTESLLRVNIWSDPLKDLLPKAKHNAKITRTAHSPTIELFEQLLATTYTKTHGEGALRAAKAKVWGFPVEESIRRSSFSDLRDRALLLLAVQMGLRASEIRDVRWSDLKEGAAGELPTLVVLGKGQKKRQIGVPPAVFSAILSLSKKIEHIAARQQRYKGEKRAVAMLQPDSPIFPAIIYWGHNAVFKKQDNKISRQGIDAIFRRRVIQAKFPKGTLEYIQSHPHGMRRLFANIAVQSGTTLNVVQATLGHESIATTGGYIDQHKATDLIAEAFKGKVTQQPTSREAVMASLIEPVRELPVPLKVPAPKLTDTPRIVKIVKKQESLEKVVPKSKKEAKQIAATATNLLTEMVYAENTWGEPKRVQKFISSARAEAIEASTAKKKEITSSAYSRVMSFMKDMGEEGSGADIDIELNISQLRAVFIGEDSGLLWWYGPGNKLKPQLPIIAPSQIGSCSVDETGELCSYLSELWIKWLDQPDRGPTASGALTAWVSEALNISRQVGIEGMFRQAKWVPFEEPLEMTRAGKLSGYERNVFRKHQTDKIAYWFESRAWKYRQTLGGGGVEEKKKGTGSRRKRTDVDEVEGRQPKVDVETYIIPKYYGDEDPILSMPIDERNEALDWVAVFTGQKAWDRTPRFPSKTGASRVDIVELLELFCAYDTHFDSIREKKKGGVFDEASRKHFDELIKASFEAIQRKVESISLGRMKDFDIDKSRKERAAARRGSITTEGTGRDSRQQSYLETVAQLFGNEASEDAAIVYAARCGRISLGTKGLKEFFNIDRSLGTIVHSEQQKQKFAVESGTHSECLARRILRDLWEARKSRKPGKDLTKERLKDLVRRIENMMAYRIPCSKAYEYELKSMLGYSKPLSLFEAWSGKVGEQAEVHLTPEQEEIMELQEESGGDADLFIPNTGLYRPNTRSVRLMPTPVALLFVVFS